MFFLFNYLKWSKWNLLQMIIMKCRCACHQFYEIWQTTSIVFIKAFSVDRDIDVSTIWGFRYIVDLENECSLHPHFNNLLSNWNRLCIDSVF